jgi:hypothetical protein
MVSINFVKVFKAIVIKKAELAAIHLLKVLNLRGENHDKGLSEDVEVKASGGVYILWRLYNDYFPTYIKHVMKGGRYESKSLFAYRSYRRNASTFSYVANGCGGAA